MKILVAIDSFKGTLSSAELGKILQDALQINNQTVDFISVSDGGEGLLEALTKPLQLQIIPVQATAPLGNKIDAFVGYSEITKTLVVELASASGLPLVPEAKRNPLHTTSYGSGELLNYAQKLNCQNILFGVGGSATSDGGVGALQALGLYFEGAPHLATGNDLIQISQISYYTSHWLEKINFQIACDVNNPFTGEKGSAKTYGPQKCSATLNANAIVSQIEEGMIHLKEMILKKTNIDLDLVPGAGAAGGIAGSMHALLKAKLSPGIKIIFDAIQLTEKIKEADLIITGEGRLDQQTINGKVVSGIIKEAQKWGRPVWALCGQNTLSPTEIKAIGLEKVYTLIENAPLEECLSNTQQVVKKTLQHLQLDLTHSNLNKN